MPNTAYCLSCEMWEQINVKGGGHLMFYEPYKGEPAGIDYCYGPFVYSEPPQPLTQEDWDAVYDNEPTWEELMKMNAEVE